MIDYVAPTLESSLNTYWPPCWCETRDQRLVRINGLARGTIWDGMTSAPLSIGITPPTTGPTVTTPTSGGATAGTYYCAYRYKDNTNGIYSSLSNLTTVTTADSDKFSWDTIPTSGESRVTHIELYRSTVDEATTLYLVTTVANTGSPTYTTDTSTDAVLVANTALPILNTDDTLNARKRGLPPDWMRVVVLFQDRAWYGVNAIYDQGTVAVSNGSANVVGTGTAWTSVMVGRKLFIPGQTVNYTVSTVTDGTHLALSTTYAGTTNVKTHYAISYGTSENNLLYFSSVDEPEAVATSQDTIVIQENVADNDILTALIPSGTCLLAAKERHIYRVTFVRQPSIDVGVIPAAWRGCLNQQCWDTDETTTYLMDARGPWALTQGGGVSSIGRAIQDLFRSHDIDWSKREWFFVAMDTNQQVVRFCVALVDQTGMRPKTAFAFSVTFGAAWKETYQEGLGGKAHLTHAGKGRFFMGGQYDTILLMGEGTSDRVSRQGSVTSATSTTLVDSTAEFTADMVGYYVYILSGTGAGQRRAIASRTSTELTVSTWTTTPDATSRYAVQYAVAGTVSSSTANTLVDSSTTFASHAAGAPVAIVSGTGAGQVRTVITASSHTLTVDSNWTTNPDTTSTYLVGAIELTWRSGIMTVPFARKNEEDPQRWLMMTYQPTTAAATLEWKIYWDHDTTAESFVRDESTAAVSVQRGATPIRVDLKRTRSALANAPGFEKYPFLAVADPNMTTRRFMATELHAFQGPEQLTVYGHEVAGAD